MQKLLSLLLCFLHFVLFAQPSIFSWQKGVAQMPSGFNYISAAKDQGEQGPCGIFAAIGGIEAMSQIYYHKPSGSGAFLNLSEAEMYSMCSGYGRFDGAANAENTLNYCALNGIINEACLAYPTTSPYYIQPCGKCSTPSQKVQIPGYERIYPTTSQSLKRDIIDYGPVIVSMQSVGGVLHPGKGCDDCGHTVLLIGWNANQWHIKDSWPGDSWIDFKTIDVFNSTYSSAFYKVKYEYNGNLIACTGNDCSAIFGSRIYTDNDGDGFYYWGIGPKPSACPGPGKMDFNDFDNSKIFIDNNYNELPTPTISGPEYVCSGTGGSFILNNPPAGFNVSWNISPSYYFNTPTSGNSTSVTLYPKAQYTGECTLTYTLSDNIGSVQYSKIFFINAPNPQLVSINVVQSYGYPPILNGSVWLLCQNSSYYIYLNNSSSCSTSNYQWNIPSGWTLYEQSQNYIRINTNSTPSAVLTVNATTCCNNSYLIKTQYFGQSYSCGGYFMVYPNPATTELNIEFADEVDLSDKNTSIEIYDANYNKEIVLKEIQKDIKINTTELGDGFHFVVLKYKGQKYTQKIKIEK